MMVTDTAQNIIVFNQMVKGYQTPASTVFERK